MNDPQVARPKRRRPVISCWTWGLIAIMLAVVLAAVVFPIFTRHGIRRPRRPSCLSHIKQIGIASLMYATDYDGHFVRMPGWDDALYPYAKNREIYRCPSDDTNGALGYGMNLDVAGSPLGSWPSTRETVAFYDGDGLEVIERHNDGANYAFMDGHAKWLADPPEDSGLQVREEARR